jgi:hypothetical protein
VRRRRLVDPRDACDDLQVGAYGGPAAVSAEGSDEQVLVTVWAMSSVDETGGQTWVGRLEPQQPGALLAAHIARRASIVIAGRTGHIQITVYSDKRCEFRGLDDPPFP